MLHTRCVCVLASHRHGLKSRGSLYLLGSKCTAGGQTITAHPAGIVYPTPLQTTMFHYYPYKSKTNTHGSKRELIHTFKFGLSQCLPENPRHYICKPHCFIDHLHFQIPNSQLNSNTSITTFPWQITNT